MDDLQEDGWLERLACSGSLSVLLAKASNLHRWEKIECGWSWGRGRGMGGGEREEQKVSSEWCW